MNKTFAVIRREYVERVRTRAFLISTLLLPVFMVAMAVLPALLMRGGDHTSRVAVVDASGAGLGQPVMTALGTATFGDSAQVRPRYELTLFTTDTEHLDQVRSGLIAKAGFARDTQPDGWNGVLVLDADTLASGKLHYYGDDVSSPNGMGRLQREISRALAGVRLAHAGVDQALVAKAMAPADVDTAKVTDGKLTGQSGKASFVLAYAMGFILYIAILSYGSRTLTSVIEEKNSRIMEVLTSSLTPFQMLMGKVLGVGLAGLTQMAIWVGTALLLGSQGPHLAGAFGIGAAAGNFAIPSMPPSLLAVFLLYFTLGFLIYGSLYAAIGAMCNTIQEAQQYAVFVTMSIVVGFMSMFGLINNPSGMLGTTMSFIPFFAPFTMPVRWSMTAVPPTQLALSLGLMVLGLLACVWLAGRIYRTGILMYGKKPSWGELWRWIRA